MKAFTLNVLAFITGVGTLQAVHTYGHHHPDF